MIRRPPRSTLDRSSAASDVYKRQALSQHEVTARLLGATHAVDETIARLAPIERDDYNRLADATRAALGAAAFDAAWMEGRAAAFDVIIEEAVPDLAGVLRLHLLHT